MPYPQFDLKRLRVFPLEERKSLTQIDDVIIDPESAPPDAGEWGERIQSLAQSIVRAREMGASVMLAYGAHLIRNGMGPVMIRMMEEGWITHLATNGAGTIHDWEYSFLGRSTESVRENVATGTFGTWQETGKNINLAVAAGVIEGRGYGESLGRFIQEDRVELPTIRELMDRISGTPDGEHIAACADLLQWMIAQQETGGRISVEHPWKKYSVVANAYRLWVPLTVHPGIGYDIISNHPGFCPAAIGRGAGIDYRVFVESVCNLSGGVFLSIGSAIMAPQVFEKAMSCANNTLLQDGKKIEGHTIAVVDMQDGGGWDWSQGEPPKDDPAYYLRFCKSFARMGADLHYICSDNRVFTHNLYHALKNL